MSIPDFINGCFESSAGVLMLFSVYRIIKDKAVRGISVVPIAFFTLWGYWNLYYYPSLNQWLSFTGGALMVLVNSIYVSLLIYYLWKERQQKKMATK